MCSVLRPQHSAAPALLTVTHPESEQLTGERLSTHIRDGCEEEPESRFSGSFFSEFVRTMHFLLAPTQAVVRKQHDLVLRHGEERNVARRDAKNGCARDTADAPVRHCHGIAIERR